MNNYENNLHLVIVANSVSNEGGVAKAARSQILALAGIYQITVVTSHGEIEHTNVKLVNVAAPKLYWLRRFSHAIREYVFCKRINSAVQTLHKNKPIDFIIFHSHTGAAISGRTFRKENAVPFAVVTHGNIFSRPAGTYDSLLTALYKWTTRISYNETDLIIALSPFMRDAAIAHGALPERVSMIPNGIAKNEQACVLYKPKNSVETGSLKLLYIGRISVEKDLTTLITGFAEAYNVNDRLTLTIIGDGPLRTECEQLVINLDVQTAVSFLGRLPQDQLAKYYSEHDVFCITSISDSLPTVVLEAMQFNLPVIATEVDGLGFIVDHQLTGCLIPPRNSDELALAIQYFYENPEKVSQYGLAGKDKVEEQFNWATVASQLHNAITNTLNQAK